MIELKHSQQDQRMNTNERNETRFVEIKEILEEIHDDTNTLDKGNNEPSSEKTVASLMDEVSIV